MIGTLLQFHETQNHCDFSYSVSKSDRLTACHPSNTYLCFDGDNGYTLPALLLRIYAKSGRIYFLLNNVHSYFVKSCQVMRVQIFEGWR
jgi:hypothetical protein